MKVSCSSEGDGVKFTLTLDGQSLIQTRDYSLSSSTRTTNPPSLTGGAAEQDNSSVTINLHGQLTGDFICNVQNNVSRGQTVFHLTSCKDLRSSLSVVTVAVVVCIVILLLVGFCLGIISLHNKSRRPISVSAVSADSPNSEVIYAHVKVKRKAKKPQPTVQNAP
ncbi:hypothetical protein INR49_002535 [Caranx melampygus]|nr:hypothetical protein INR49_002535 [Caranx melampygus]